MTKRDQIQEVLDKLPTDELVAIHNEFCDEAGHVDNYIYPMDEFDEIMSGTEPWEIARSAFYGGFKPVCDYFWFNGYGNLASSDYPEEDQICTWDIARFIEEEKNDFGIEEIAEILDEEDEEDEEEE